MSFFDDIAFSVASEEAKKEVKESLTDIENSILREALESSMLVCVFGFISELIGKPRPLNFSSCFPFSFRYRLKVKKTKIKKAVHAHKSKLRKFNKRIFK